MVQRRQVPPLPEKYPLLP